MATPGGTPEDHPSETCVQPTTNTRVTSLIKSSNTGQTHPRLDVRAAVAPRVGGINDRKGHGDAEKVGNIPAHDAGAGDTGCPPGEQSLAPTPGGASFSERSYTSVRR